MLPRIEEVDQPRRAEDPVFHALVVVAVRAEQLSRAMMMRARQRRPLRRVGRFAHQRERRHREAGGRNEVVILREVELPLARLAAARTEVVVDEPGVPFQRRAHARALGLGEIVIEQIVRPPDRIEQMTRRQIHVRLVVGVAPRLVVDRREHPSLRRVAIFRLLLDRPRQADAGDRERHVVLRAARLRSRRRRRRHPSARAGRPARASIPRDAWCAPAAAASRFPRDVTNTRGCTPASSGFNAIGCASSASNDGTLFVSTHRSRGSRRRATHAGADASITMHHEQLSMTASSRSRPTRPDSANSTMRAHRREQARYREDRRVRKMI